MYLFSIKHIQIKKHIDTFDMYTVDVETRLQI